MNWYVSKEPNNNNRNQHLMLENRQGFRLSLWVWVANGKSGVVFSMTPVQAHLRYLNHHHPEAPKGAEGPEDQERQGGGLGHGGRNPAKPLGFRLHHQPENTF